MQQNLTFLCYKRIREKKNIFNCIDLHSQLSSITSDLVLIHRRKEFRAAPESVAKMLKLEKEKKIKFIKGQIKEIKGQNGKIDHVVYSDEENIGKIETEFLLPFFGLKMELGPIAEWGLNLHENRISVDTEKYETSVPQIFAIGDINYYPGKLKLILSGFHECALMAQQCFKYCYPDKKNIFRYTTSSKDLHKKLGV